MKTTSRRSGAGLSLLLSVTLMSLLTEPGTAEETSRPPNVVFVFCDNLGYGDIEPFGSTLHRTPHLNRMAREGLKLTHHYSASGVCTPSRSALMTGCYPRRVGMDVTDGAVLRPVSRIGLHPDEITIAEVLQAQGYATAIFGKWHLGDQLPFLPTRQGFDHYLGIPYSDDMTPRPGQPWPPLPLMLGERVVEAPVDRDLLTRRLTEAAIDWMELHRDQPFFLYFPQCMPGSTAAPFASPEFQGRSRNGPWGDSVEELDWSTGELLKALKRLNLDEQTLFVWTSDNGAPRRNPVQGSNQPLAGWGYTTAEGGMRVPCLVRWPGRIPAGTTSSELTTLMDWYPTLAEVSGAAVPAEPIRDGRSLVKILTDPADARSPHESFYYYRTNELQAVRMDRWKLYLDRPTADQPSAARLFDVVADPGETRNLINQHPRIVERIERLAEQARTDIGDGSRTGRNERPSARWENPTPRVKLSGSN